MGMEHSLWNAIFVLNLFQCLFGFNISINVISPWQEGLQITCVCRRHGCEARNYSGEGMSSALISCTKHGFSRCQMELRMIHESVQCCRPRKAERGVRKAFSIDSILISPFLMTLSDVKACLDDKPFALGVAFVLQVGQVNVWSMITVPSWKMGAEKQKFTLVKQRCWGPGS